MNNPSFYEKRLDLAVTSSQLLRLFAVLPIHRFMSVSPRHNSRGRPLFMRVLSHSDSHHLNRHMVGCGCHEIMIHRCITVLFLSNFSLKSTQLWFWWMSYSNHSFQLISIQYSVHQSCYQEPFISTSNRRQAHTQSRIFCCHSSKACEFIASAVYKIHSSSKSKVLAVPKR